MGRYYRGGRRPGPRRPGGGMGWVRQARHGNGAVSPAQNSSSLTGVVESFTTCGPQIFYLHALKWFPRVHSHGRMSHTVLDISPLSRDNKSEEP